MRGERIPHRDTDVRTARGTSMNSEMCGQGSEKESKVEEKHRERPSVGNRTIEKLVSFFMEGDFFY